MLVKDFKTILDESDDKRKLCVFLNGNILAVEDLRVRENRVELIIDATPVADRDIRIDELEQRIEELEGQNDFECGCVSERDNKLQEIRKRIMKIHKKN